jgi:hypothetical protein
MELIADVSDLTKELVNILVNLIPVVRYSCISDLDELLLKHLKVIIKSFHDVHDDWPEIYYLVILVLTFHSTHFANEDFVTVLA